MRRGIRSVGDGRERLRREATRMWNEGRRNKEEMAIGTDVGTAGFGGKDLSSAMEKVLKQFLAGELLW